ncbi:serine/threonine-protein kinase [Streptomyces sp. NPDC048002]|uniref:serine/threonine-protein kinase n=1 Tax=Streptomyces sp. NPDC048002 TaxID=3154344 RepID=UPI0033E342BB
MPLHRDDPRSVGGYRLVDRLGAGGMGVVYRGRSRSGREVAVKVVHAQYAEDTVFRTRFRQEIEAVRKVSGAFTAPVVDADPDAARPWMATQYVPGRSLAERIREAGPLGEDELRRLALGLVEALRDIHRAGVVHRDLKPANVLLAEDGPRVIDFGISRAAENHTLTETGQMIGTPPFMSPEQLTDARSVGPASDVFALGALLVYTLTGRGPFDTDSPYLTAYRVVHHEPVLDGLRPPLRAVLERCLVKEAADRPGLDEVARDLAAVLPEEPAGAVRAAVRPAEAPREDAGSPEPRARLRRGRRLWAVTGTVGALALGLTAYLLSGPGWSSDAGPAAASRWAGPPGGWQPWQTTVYATAERGVKQGDDVSGTDILSSGPECREHADDIYCAGDGVLPVRLDGLTGRALWRAGPVPPATSGGTNSFGLLGFADGALLVEQTHHAEDSEEYVTSVAALDTATGERLWHREVNNRWADHPFLLGDVVVVPGGDGRTVTARSARTGAGRWTQQLPEGLYCGVAHLGEAPWLACGADKTPVEEVLLLRFDRAGGWGHRLSVPDRGVLVGELDGRLLFLDPAEDENGNLAIGDDGPHSAVRLVDPDTGEARTTKLAEQFEGTVTHADGMLWFTASGGQVTGVSARTGERLWRTRTSLEKPGAVTYDPRARAVYLSSASGRVAALDARGGTLLWETLPRAERVTDQTWELTRVIAHGGALVAATPEGDVFSLDPAHPGRKPVPG